MATDTINVTSTLATETCCNCGMTFAMPADYQRRRRDDHDCFYCPAGHAQHYTGKSEAEKLRDEVAALKSAREFTEARLASVRKERDHVTKRLQATQGVVTRTKNRIHKGVCPCCQRSFEDLRRHMATKHPDYAKVDA